MTEDPATIARPFAGPEDGPRLQAFTAAAVRRAGQSGHLHPGDVAHRLFNGLRHEDPAELVRIWEDAAGVAAWAMVAPSHAGFDAQVRPDRRGRGDPLEAEVVEWATARTCDVVRTRDTKAYVTAEAYDDDGVRIAVLEALGWTQGDDRYTLTLRSLDDLPEVTAPGYSIRPVRGPDEAAVVGELHAAAFGSTWHPGQYRRVMALPGYAPERELLAEAEDGSLGGFTVTWHDEVNAVGLFEPVGVHPAHRRSGVARALLAAGMGRMAAAGMTRAMVMYENANVASGALYRGIGFVPTWTLLEYRQPLDAAAAGGRRH